jgi:hypothetical protein
MGTWRRFNTAFTCEAGRLFTRRRSVDLIVGPDHRLMCDRNRSCKSTERDGQALT